MVANEAAPQLLLYGIAYNRPMDVLKIVPAAKGNERIADNCVVRPTVNLALSLIRHPYKQRIIGVKIDQPIALSRKYFRGATHSRGSANIFVALAERWFAEESGISDAKRLTEEVGVSFMAHRFAEEIGMIPVPVFEQMHLAFTGAHD